MKNNNGRIAGNGMIEDDYSEEEDMVNTKVSKGKYGCRLPNEKNYESLSSEVNIYNINDSNKGGKV